jgi:hypothetical protein
MGKQMHTYLRGPRGIFLATALCVGSASGAAAQSAGQENASPSRGASFDTAGTRSSTRAEAPARAAASFDFEGDEIDGARTRADGTTIFGLDRIEHASLIRLREHFLSDIIASAENL